jgi:hypothetical protein
MGNVKGQVVKSIFVGAVMGITVGYFASDPWLGLGFAAGGAVGDLAYSMYKKLTKKKD